MENSELSEHKQELPHSPAPSSPVGKSEDKRHGIIKEGSESKPGEKTSTEKQDVVELKKSIGLFSAVGLIVGSIIGSGIFISPTGVLNYSGSVGLSLVIWVICGLYALLGCITFSELGTLIPDSGGKYIYLLEGFAQDRKKTRSWWRPLFAFLFNWQTTLLLQPAALAIQSLTCGEYLVRIGSLACPDMMAFQSPQQAVRLIASCLILALCYMNVSSVKAATRVINTFTSAKVIALILIIIGGIVSLSQGYTSELKKGFEGSNYDFANIVAAVYSGIWAYGGWDSIGMVAREMKNPKRDLPLALAISILLVIFCYLAVNISYLTVLTTDEFLSSNAVAVSFGGRVAGSAGAVLMIISVACSTLGTANGSLFCYSRITHVAAREGHMMQVLSFIHIRNMTPSSAVILNTLLAAMFVWSSEILTLISLIGFVEGFFLGVVMISLFVMRRTRKDDYRTIKAPLIVPVLVLLFAIFLVVTPLVASPQIEYYFVVIFFFVGVIVYTLFVHFGKILPGNSEFTKKIQIILQVVPADVKEI